MELQKSTLNRLHIAYQFCLFIGTSKYESTSLLSLCLMYNSASQLLGIWCIDLCVDLIAMLIIF